MSKVLQELIQSENAAREFGFDWPNAEMIMEWAISECQEVLTAIKDQESKQRIQEEIGDVLHAAISFCLFSGFDVEETLAKTTNKFEQRMHWLKIISERRGFKDLRGQSMELMLEIWGEAKKATAASS